MGKLIDRFKNPKTKTGKYALNLFVAGDQLLGAMVGYDPDQTISSHLGKLESQPGGIPKNRPVARGLAWILNRLDRNHCKEAIEADEGKDSLRDRELMRMYQDEHTYHGE